MSTINNKYIFDIQKWKNYEISIESSDTILNIEIDEDKNFGKIIVNKTKYTLNYFNGELTKITIIVSSISNCIIKIDQKDIEIKQLYIADHLGHFANDLKSYNLEKYHNEFAPAIFYGMFSDNDFKILCKNKSLKIIVWTGIDIDIVTPVCKNKNINKINLIKKMTKIKHIAESKFIANNLDKLKTNYIRVPFMGINFNLYKPRPKGNCIYVYTSPIEGKKYGEDLYSQIVKKYSNIEFIFACSEGTYLKMKERNKKNIYNITHYPKEILINEIYPRCFLGLRLTPYDGLASTVQELGCFGIKSVHNGDSPSSLNYKSLDDICKHVDNEIKTIGTTDIELSEIVKNYLTLDKYFFNTKFYETR